jgi:hypothetical protein
MEDNEIAIPAQKIYSEKNIWRATFLGGPLVAGYLLAENFKAFNEPEKVRNTWIVAVIATIIIFGGIFLMSDIEKLPRYLIPIIYAAIVYLIAQRYQSKSIKRHILDGGLMFSVWRALGISLIGAVITFLLIFIVAISIPDDSVGDTTRTYGAMKHEISFNTDNISEAEVDRLADAFTKSIFFDDAVTKYVYVEKKENNYELFISCDPSVAEDEGAYLPFIQLKNDVTRFFPKNKIVLNLVVDDISNVVKRIE